MDDTTAVAPAEQATGPGRARRWAGLALRVLGAFLVALLLAEATLRVFGVRLPPRPPNVKTHLLDEVSEEQMPGLGLVLRPGASGESVYPGAREGELRRVRYQINELGFRDRVTPRQKPPGTYRITMLGDSITYGTGLNLDETLPRQLEPELSALLPGSKIEVLNCGVPATNTGQEVALLRYRVLPLDPDLVIITSSLEDASGYGIRLESSTPHPEIEWLDRLGLTSGIVAEGEPLTPSQARLMPWRRHSVLVDLLANRAYSLLYCRLSASTYHDYWRPGSAGVTNIRESLALATRLARQHGFALRVHLYPSLTVLSDDYPFAPETELLAGMCRDFNIPFLDLMEPLRGLPAESLRVHAHDRHPNAKANALVATWLAKQLAPVVAADIAKGN